MSKKNEQDFSYHYTPAIFYGKKFEILEKPLEIDNDPSTEYEKFASIHQQIIRTVLSDINENPQRKEEKKEIEKLDEQKPQAISKENNKVLEEIKESKQKQELDLSLPTQKLETIVPKPNVKPGKAEVVTEKKESLKEEIDPNKVLPLLEQKIIFPKMNKIQVPNLDTFCFDYWQSLSSLRQWAESEPERYQYINILLEECNEPEFTFAKTFWNEVNHENVPAVPQPNLHYSHLVYMTVYAILWHYAFKKPELIFYIIKGLETGKSEFFPRIQKYPYDDISFIIGTLKSISELGLKTHNKYYHFEEKMEEEFQSNIEQFFFDFNNAKTIPNVTSGLANLGQFIIEIYKLNFMNKCISKNETNLIEEIFIMQSALSDCFRINIDFGYINYQIGPTDDSHIKWTALRSPMKKLISNITLFMGSSHLHAGILLFSRIVDPEKEPFSFKKIADAINNLQ